MKLEVASLELTRALRALGERAAWRERKTRLLMLEEWVELRVDVRERSGVVGCCCSECEQLKRGSGRLDSELERVAARKESGFVHQNHPLLHTTRIASSCYSIPFNYSRLSLCVTSTEHLHFHFAPL